MWFDVSVVIMTELNNSVEITIHAFLFISIHNEEENLWCWKERFKYSFGCYDITHEISLFALTWFYLNLQRYFNVSSHLDSNEIDVMKISHTNARTNVLSNLYALNVGQISQRKTICKYKFMNGQKEAFITNHQNSNYILFIAAGFGCRKSACSCCYFFSLGLLFSMSVCICDIFRNFRIEQSKQSRLFAHLFRCNREMHLPGGFAKWMDRLWPLGIGVQIESIAERPI